MISFSVASTTVVVTANPSTNHNASITLLLSVICICKNALTDF